MRQYKNFAAPFIVILVLFLLFPMLNLCQAGDANISFVNPLKFSTVEGLLGSLLISLQGVIVVLSMVFIMVGAVFYVTSAGNQERVTTAKKAIFASLIGLAIGVAAPSFLKEIYTVLGGQEVLNTACKNVCDPNPNSPECKECEKNLDSIKKSRPIVQIALNTLNFLLSIIGTLALIMLVIGSIMYLSVIGDEKVVGTAKEIIKFALIGITIALLSLVIVRLIAQLITG